VTTESERKLMMLDRFCKELKYQVESGSERYALESGREANDIICEIVGNNWQAANIIKYACEIVRLSKAGEPIPAAGFFKMAVYSFLWWSKTIGQQTSRDKGEETVSVESSPMSGKMWMMTNNELKKMMKECKRRGISTVEYIKEKYSAEE
jgi:hypothetical protein